MRKKIFFKGLLSISVFNFFLILPLFASENYQLDRAQNLANDQNALQRGAKLYINYCLGCHSANAVRFNTLQEIGFSKETIEKNLLFVGSNINDLMKIPSQAEDAKNWFGIIPPDLSTATRVRSPDWIYTFLRKYYLDDKSTHGFNNQLYQNTSMPNVFWQLQGIQKLQGDELILSKTGILNPQEFDQTVAELTAYINWMSDPKKSERHKIGYLVIFFMLIITLLTYLLQKEFWKDIK